MNIVWPLLGGVAVIALLLGAMALALYLIWWFVMLIVSFIPMVGKRHKHADWERLNRGG
jgi:hypothetical protein